MRKHKTGVVGIILAALIGNVFGTQVSAAEANFVNPKEMLADSVIVTIPHGYFYDENFELLSQEELSKKNTENETYILNEDDTVSIITTEKAANEAKAQWEDFLNMYWDALFDETSDFYEAMFTEGTINKDYTSFIIVVDKEKFDSQEFANFTLQITSGNLVRGSEHYQAYSMVPVGERHIKTLFITEDGEVLYKHPDDEEAESEETAEETKEISETAAPEEENNNSESIDLDYVALDDENVTLKFTSVSREVFNSGYDSEFTNYKINFTLTNKSDEYTAIVTALANRFYVGSYSVDFAIDGGSTLPGTTNDTSSLNAYLYTQPGFSQGNTKGIKHIEKLEDLLQFSGEFQIELYKTEGKKTYIHSTSVLDVSFPAIDSVRNEEENPTEAENGHVTKVKQIIDEINISEADPSELLYLNNLYDSLSDDEKNKIPDKEKVYEANDTLFEYFLSEYDRLNELFEKSAISTSIETKDFVSARRETSEVLCIANDLKRLGFTFTEEQYAELEETIGSIDEFCYQDTGIVKLEYIVGRTFSLDEISERDVEKAASSDFISEDCYYYGYGFSPSEDGHECFEQYRQYLNDHFSYVTEGTDENETTYYQFKDDMGKNIYVTYSSLIAGEYNLGFLKIEFDRDIVDKKTHFFYGNSLLECAPIKYAETGDVIHLGRYEQDDVPLNGPEPLKWIVLDEKEDALLVISEKVLDAHPYSNERKDTTWETSESRSWLNISFIEAAFTEGEQKLLISSKVPADDNPGYGTFAGNETEDRLFYLSAAEAMKYYPEYETRICKPTPYALSALYPDEDGNVAWTLRTPGEHQDNVCIIARNLGAIMGIGDYEVSLTSGGKGIYVDADGAGVRPAMWISKEYADEDLEVDEEQFIPETEETEEAEETEAVFTDPTVYTDVETVRAAQTALNEAGFDCGTPDGQAGNMTRAAVTKYQEANGLEVTGNIDGTLLHSLGLM